ncbi:hypothetical protein C0J52_23353 [Blattella germanica]|nr:hypothetical protein C0J52_23353 [Blattella germanica]
MELKTEHNDIQQPTETSPENVVSPDPGTQSEELQRERVSIIVNIILVSFGCMLQFTAVYGTYAIQSTIHIENNLGKISLCCHYVAAAISSITLSTAFVRRFGCKSTIVGSIVTYIPYGFSQFYATPYTIIPAGIFCGLGTGPLWVGVNTYLVVMSRAYSRLVNGDFNKIIWHSFGLFFMISSCSRIIGYAILVGIGTSKPINVNSSVNLSGICGANFITIEKSMQVINLKRPQEKELYVLHGIYITFVVGACLTIWCFLDSPQRAISSISTGWLMNIKGGSPIYFTTSVLQFALLMYLIFWCPASSTDIPIYFVVSGLWGICNGSMLVSINALYGILFPLNLEAAYSNSRLFEAIGFALGFGYSPFLNIRIKLGILIAMLTIAIGGFIDTEIRFRKENKNIRSDSN